VSFLPDQPVQSPVETANIATRRRRQVMGGVFFFVRYISTEAQGAARTRLKACLILGDTR